MPRIDLAVPFQPIFTSSPKDFLRPWPNAVSDVIELGSGVPEQGSGSWPL